MPRFTIYLSAGIIFAGIAYYLQSNMFLCGDVAYLLHVTQVMLAGGTYAKDFFETNPPMILLLYTPVVFIAKYFSMNIIVVLRIYILSLGLFSFSLIFYIFKKLYTPSEFSTVVILNIALLYVLFFLPAGDFGQREHLFVILFLPYVFGAAVVSDENNLPFVSKLLIGCLAGLAIGMKPFFLAPFILIEIFLILKVCVLRKLFRVEVIACASVLFVYLAGVYWFEPSYIHIILPLVSKFYFISSRETWAVIGSRVSVIFCFLTTCYFILLIFFKKITSLDYLLFFALAGAIIAFVLPRSAWYYHLIPALSFGILLLSRMIMQQNKKWFAGVALMLLTVPLIDSLNYSRLMLQDRKISDREKVIAYLQTRSEVHSVNCFSASYTQDCFPLVFVADLKYAGRSPFFWWLRGLVGLESQHQHSFNVQQNKDYLIKSISEDLNVYKADVIIVNQNDFIQKLGNHFDVIKYFSQNENFHSAWKNYYFVAQFGGYQLFQRKV